MNTPDINRAFEGRMLAVRHCDTDGSLREAFGFGCRFLYGRGCDRVGLNPADYIGSWAGRIAYL